jgi:hypothetical protein
MVAGDTDSLLIRPLSRTSPLLTLTAMPSSDKRFWLMELSISVPSRKRIPRVARRGSRPFRARKLRHPPGGRRPLARTGPGSRGVTSFPRIVHANRFGRARVAPSRSLGTRERCVAARIARLRLS